MSTHYRTISYFLAPKRAHQSFSQHPLERDDTELTVGNWEQQKRDCCKHIKVLIAHTWKYGVVVV